VAELPCYNSREQVMKEDLEIIYGVFDFMGSGVSAINVRRGEITSV